MKEKGTFDLVVLAVGSAFFILFVMMQGIIIGEDSISADLAAETSHSDNRFHSATAGAAILNMEDPDVIEHAKNWEKYDHSKRYDLRHGDGYDHEGIEAELEQVLSAFVNDPGSQDVGEYHFEIEDRPFTLEEGEPSGSGLETYIAAPDGPLELQVRIDPA